MAVQLWLSVQKTVESLSRVYKEAGALHLIRISGQVHNANYGHAEGYSEHLLCNTITCLVRLDAQGVSGALSTHSSPMGGKRSGEVLLISVGLVR